MFLAILIESFPVILTEGISLEPTLIADTFTTFKRVVKENV